MLTSKENLVLSSVNKKLSTLAVMVEGICAGQISGLVIDGEKGLGKSHTVKSILSKYDSSLPENSELPDNKALFISSFTGKITPKALFNTLQSNSTSRNVILFDDCDSAWNEISALNLLKAAMDTNKRRVVTWASSTSSDQESSFEFNGRVIIITNAKSIKSAHYKAFLDRVFKYNLRMTAEEKLVKIKEIAISDESYNRDTAIEVVSHIEEYKDMLGARLSMRTFVKVYKLTQMPIWKELAVQTVFQEDED